MIFLHGLRWPGYILFKLRELAYILSTKDLDVDPTSWETKAINGEGVLDEKKLLASFLMPEDYPPENFTWEQLQSARACGLSFVSRDRYPRFATLCGLAAGRPSGQDETVLRGRLEDSLERISRKTLVYS